MSTIPNDPNTDQNAGATPTPEDVPAPFDPAEHEWTQWSDGEVMGRLLRRGVEAVMAKGLVRDRRTPEAGALISEELERVYRDEDGKPIRFETPLEHRARR